MHSLQADCILLVAAEDATSDVTAAEFDTVWRKMIPESRRASMESTHATQHYHEFVASQGHVGGMDIATLATMDSAAGVAFTSVSDSEACSLVFCGACTFYADMLVHTCRH